MSNIRGNSLLEAQYNRRHEEIYCYRCRQKVSGVSVVAWASTPDVRLLVTCHGSVAELTVPFMEASQLDTQQKISARLTEMLAEHDDFKRELPKADPLVALRKRNAEW